MHRHDTRIAWGHRCNLKFIKFSFEGDISADALRVRHGQGGGADGAGDAAGLGEQERHVVGVQRHGAVRQCGLHEGEATGDGEKQIGGRREVT